MNANWQRYGQLLSTIERILSLMGIWPSRQIPKARVVIVATLMAFITSFIVKTFVSPERTSIQDGLVLWLGAVMVVLLLARITFNEIELLQIVDYIKDDLKRTPISDIGRETLDEIGRDIHFIVKFVTVLFPLATILKLFMPFLKFGYGLIIRDENASILLPSAMGLPTLRQLGFYGDLLTYILECIMRSIMFFWLLGGAILFVACVLYIGGQFQTLAKEFETISIADVATFDSFIKRHEFIIHKAQTLTRIYSTHFFVESAVSYINMAVLLLSMSSTHRGIDNVLDDMLLTMAGSTQFGLVVIYGGHIMNCSLLVYQGAYMSNWIGAPVAQQKKLVFLLRRAQKPTKLTFHGNFVTASLEFLTDILRNSYAAFNLLRNTIH